MAAGALGGLLAGLIPAIPATAASDAPLTLAKGARVAVINLLDPEVTHFHAAKQIKDSFLKTQTVGWPVDSMLSDSVKDRLTQMGLSPVPLPATDALLRSREDCFLNANLNKGLPRECNQQFEQLASSQHVDAMIVLAPGLNNTAHAGSARHKDLPDYLRGWGFVTNESGPSDRPTLFSNTELVLIDPTPTGIALRGREWGGFYSLQWLSYVAPPDPKVISPQQLDQLQPLFADLLSRQVNRLLDQLHVMP